jgi:hypothetical protein
MSPAHRKWEASAARASATTASSATMLEWTSESSAMRIDDPAALNVVGL